jgi:hypothetical protein
MCRKNFPQTIDKNKSCHAALNGQPLGHYFSKNTIKIIIMRSRLLRKRKKYIDFIKKVSTDTMRPFTERPSAERYTEKSADNKVRLCADDLFSIFTANIIKEEVTFTR